MAAVRQLVVYQLRVIAGDSASGKTITNTLYAKSIGDGTGAYGGDIAGTSDATLYDSMWSGWLSNIMPLLHENYTASKYIGNAIVGRRWPTPIIPITAANLAGTQTLVTCSVAHGLSTGMSVEIGGNTAVPSINSVWPSITVVSPFSFTIPLAVTTGGTGGQVQRATGQQEFVYDQNVEAAYTNSGGVSTSEALPLVCTASMRRTNSGKGRNWRSRLSLGIIAEGSQKDGALTSAAVAAFNTAGSAMGTSNYDCGGSVNAQMVAVSKNLAFLGPTTFTQSTAWAKFTGLWIVQPNLGSMTKRKPKLTQAIS